MSKAMIHTMDDKYLTFKLANEEYGISILKVKEIIGIMDIHEVPDMPSFVKGVINLRDKVIPVVDLRVKFSLPEIEPSEKACIIVVEIQRKDMTSCHEVMQCHKEDCLGFGNLDRRCWMLTGTLCRNEIQGSFHEKKAACRQCKYYQKMHREKAVNTTGIIVDGVSEVVSILAEQIEEPPGYVGQEGNGSILGIAKINGNVKMLLDIDTVLTSHETAPLATALQ